MGDVKNLLNAAKNRRYRLLRITLWRSPALVRRLASATRLSTERVPSACGRLANFWQIARFPGFAHCARQ